MAGLIWKGATIVLLLAAIASVVFWVEISVRVSLLGSGGGSEDVFQHNGRNMKSSHHTKTTNDLCAQGEEKQKASNIKDAAASHLLPPVCTALKSTKAGSTWIDNFDKVLSASRHPQDTSFDRYNHTRLMLLSLPPSLLRQSLKSRPKHDEIGRIVSIVEKRRNDPKAPPLTILVMGGSIALGVLCEEDERIKGPKCAWPYRLEAFLNSILGFDAVKVVAMAIGGTSSAEGQYLLKYGIYPSMAAGPDIVINAYAANDAMSEFYIPDQMNQGDDQMEKVKKQYSSVIKRLDDFVNVALGMCPTPPVMMLLDDHVGGHKQKGVGLQVDMMYSSAMARVASWYHTFAVSPAESIRKMVLAELQGGTLSLPWRGENYDVHYGFSTHIAVMWAFTYSLLDVLVEFCDDVETREAVNQLERVGQKKLLISESSSNLIESVPPPSLMDDLMIENVATKWRERAAVLDKGYCQGLTTCEISWVAGHDNKNPKRYLQKFVPKSSKGWKVSTDRSLGDRHRIGFVPTGVNASTTLEVRNIGSQIRMITILSMKNYGDKWAESRALFTVHAQVPGEAAYSTIRVFEVEGFHEMKTSVLLTTEVDFGEAKIVPVGSNVTIQVDLIGGKAFKIGGMMVCNR